MQIPRLETMNLVIQSCHSRPARTATHSLDLESSRTPAVHGSSVCRRRDWHFLYVSHARTYLIAIVVQSVLRPERW